MTTKLSTSLVRAAANSLQAQLVPPLVSIGPGGIGNYTQKEVMEDDVSNVSLGILVLSGALLNGRQ